MSVHLLVVNVTIEFPCTVIQIPQKLALSAIQSIRPMELIRAAFDDIDAMSEALRVWDVEFIPIDRKPYEDKGDVGNFVQGFGSNVLYGYSRFAPGLSMFGAPPGRLITFNVMGPTNRRYWVRGYDLDDTMAWVFPVGAELRSVSAPGFEVHTLSASEEYIEQISDSLGERLLSHSKRSEHFAIRPEFLACIRLNLYQMRCSTMKVSSELADEVLKMLVVSWVSSSSSRRDSSVFPCARENAVRRSLEFIEEHINEKIQNEKLLKESNVSERTLQYAFRERFGVTPQAYIKSRRLAKARLALKHAKPGRDTVGSIATNHGFWQLGRFAVDYRNSFGELPSETLRKSLRRY